MLLYIILTNEKLVMSGRTYLKWNEKRSVKKAPKITRFQGHL